MSDAFDIRVLAVELQSLGVRTIGGVPREETRAGGAGPSDAGFVWFDGAPLTVPVHGDYVASSPFEVRMAASGESGTLYRDDVEVGPIRLHPRPRIYDLETADGIPYWKIGLMHLDSFASTVMQHCVYWGTDEQCHFCAIGTSLANGRTIPVKTPELLAEVAAAAQRLDGAKDVTLTTGSPNRSDRGAPYMARCAEAIREASGLPVQVQIEPPDDFSWFPHLKDSGVEALGLHLEVWDEDVLARVAPGKHAQGRDHYLAAWDAAVEVFGHGQVSTYFILGLGESVESAVEGAATAIAHGVYPFVVPLRPSPGSIRFGDTPPSVDHVREVYERIAPLLAEAEMLSQNARAGCVRCQACSALSTFERAYGGGRNEAGPIGPLTTPEPARAPAPAVEPRRPALNVRIAGGPDELSAHHAIRHAVFVDEQGIFAEHDLDEWDDGAIHVVAALDGEIVGAVRLYPLDDFGLWKGDRLAVLPRARARVGAALVRFAVATAGNRGGQKMIAQIQEGNVAFFTRLGWEPTGPPREHHGVPHQQMAITLAGARAEVPPDSIPALVG